MIRALALCLALCAGASPAQETPGPADSLLSTTDPVGGVAGPFRVVPQTRTIFFGTDRESFDEVGITKLAVLADAARRAGAGSAVVVGHTDTQGDARYNAGLSERRATTVRRDLIARGVPAAAVTVRALGQTELAVATADGVAEAANRRVVVTLDGAGAFPAPDEDAPIRLRLP